MFIFSNRDNLKTQGIMCDEDSSSLQNIPQSVPRREPKIILQRAEYTFPALKDSLVSVFIFVRIEQKTINVLFPEHFATKLIALLNLLEVFTLLSHCIWNVLSYKEFDTLCMVCKLSYRSVNLQFLNMKL
jgi:hypothetical protein